MPALNPLGAAALRVRNHNVQDFDEFLGRVEDYYNGLAKDLIVATPNDILVAQGRTQSIEVILRTLKECHLPRPQKPSTAP